MEKFYDCQSTDRIEFVVDGVNGIFLKEDSNIGIRPFSHVLEGFPSSKVVNT